MAIIYTYGYDSNINGADALIGTDSTGRKTKQFRVSDLTDYISDNISVAAGVNTITTIDGKFISLTPNTPQNGDVIVTAVLSASGTANETTYLRGDNTWATIPSGEDNYVDSISFNTGTGDLTLGRTGVLPDLVQSLDGRYALSGAAGVTYDLASSQNVNDVDITLTGSDASVDTVTLVAGTNITLTDDGSNNITIDADAAAGGEADFVYFTVKNETGVTINKGKGVMAVGTDGNSGHILIDEMIGDGTVEPKFFLGVLETSVDNGNFARVISFGRLDQFNTNGQNGETWNDGDLLWCDPDSPGDFTIVEPNGPNVKIAAAIVLNASTNGKIQVRVQANEGIHDLHDTRIVPQQDGDVLVWNDTDGVWFNDDTLNVDYTNSRIGVGTSTPANKLDVLTNEAGASGITVTSTNTGSTSTASVMVTNGSAGRGGALNYIPPTYTAFPVLANYLDLVAYSQTNGFIIRTSGTGNIKFLQGGINAANERFTINTSDVTVNTGLSNVDFRVKGTSGDVLFVDASAARVGIGQTNPAERLHVTGNIRVGAISDNVFSNRFIAVGDGDVEIISNIGYNLLLNSGNQGNIGIGTDSPDSKLDVNGGIKMADDTATASEIKEGTLRYRTDSNNSYLEMCMQTGPNITDYTWVVIKQNSW